MSNFGFIIFCICVISNIMGFWLIFIRRKKSILALIVMAVSGYTTSIIFLEELVYFFSIYYLEYFVGVGGCMASAAAFAIFLPILTWNYLWHIDNNQ